MKVRTAGRGFRWAGQLHVCQPGRGRCQTHFPLSLWLQRGGWSCWVSLCQPGAEINAWSWSLASREQRRVGSHPSPVKDPASGEPLSWISQERTPPPPFQFINLEGLPPMEIGARPYLLLEKVRPPQHLPTHNTHPLGSRCHPPLSVPLSLEELSSVLTQLKWPPSSLPVSPTVRVGYWVCRVSPWNSEMGKITLGGWTEAGKRSLPTR